MSEPTISKDDLFRAVLALDVYHRGYNAGLDVQGTQIGDATIGRKSSDNNGDLIGLSGPFADQTIGFFAQEYTWNGSTVIAYRGTDDDFSLGSQGDAKNGYGLAIGKPGGPQGRAAIEFFKSIAQGDPFAANIELVGQSLGTAAHAAPVTPHP